MSKALTKIINMTLIIFAGSVLSVWGWGEEEPQMDNSATTQKLESLPRVEGNRKVVTIYEFRSSVPEISAAAATDMFTTALIKSGTFTVAERERLNQGVAFEKQLNA